MYDPFDKAELVLDLRKPSQITSEDLILHVRVCFRQPLQFSVLNIFSIVLSYFLPQVGDKRLSFEVSSRDEVASWMRTMSNFSMRAAAAALPEVNVDPLGGLVSSSTDDQKSSVATL